jgi:hypothetical protein
LPLSKNRKIIYAIWIIGFFVSIAIAYSIHEVALFLFWVLVILISNFLLQGNDLKKRVDAYEAKTA